MAEYRILLDGSVSEFGITFLTPQEWTDVMLGSEEEFKSWEKYGIKNIETVAGKKEEKSADPVSGISGTFKKLNCD